MDVGVTTATRYSNGTTEKTAAHHSSTGGSGGVGRQHSGSSSGGSSSKQPSTPNKHVNFTGPSEEKKREKFLTAKYGAHQMALIRKRLRVEMWMYERLQEIYGAADDIEIDLDEVLDMDSEMERRQYISNHLKESDLAARQESVNIFVGDLLEKVKTL